MSERETEHLQEETDVIHQLEEPEVVPDSERYEEGVVDLEGPPVQEDDERGDDIEPLGGEEVR